MNRKKNRIITLATASVAALLAAMVANNFLAGNRPVEQPAQQEVKKEVVEVLTVTSDLPMGARLRGDMLEWREWPKDNLLPGMIVRSEDENAIDELEGARLKAPMVADEPVLRSKVAGKGEGGLLSSLLRKGMRAVALEVTVESGAGGFIMPNDRVDVLLTRNIDGHVSSEVVLENVRVLAINQTSAADKTDKEAESDLRTVTLEVTPLQAKVLARAQSLGQLSLVLRSLSDRGAGAAADDMPRLAPAFARTGGGEIRFYRYGKFGVQASQN